MTRRKTWFALVLMAFAVAVSARLTVSAQERSEPKSGPSTRIKAPVSVQDALLQPFKFTFNKPTPLDEVTRHLSLTLNAPVAIDRPALDRRGLKVNDEVQL